MKRFLADVSGSPQQVMASSSLNTNVEEILEVEKGGF